MFIEHEPAQVYVIRGKRASTTTGTMLGFVLATLGFNSTRRRLSQNQAPGRKVIRGT